MIEVNSRKERERQRNIFDIIQVTGLLVSERGLNAVSMDEIAKEAGFGKGTLYNYFQNKEDLMSCMFKVHFEKYLLEIHRIANTDAPFINMIKSMLEFTSNYLNREKGVTQLLDQLSYSLQEKGDTKLKTEALLIVAELHKFYPAFFKKAMDQGLITKRDPIRFFIAVFNTLTELQRSSQSGIIPNGESDNIEFVLQLFFPECQETLN
jgi:AcrR family transcriptional regulator